MKGLVPKLVKALMVTLALKLYSYSREFRYISRILQQEKRELKVRFLNNLHMILELFTEPYFNSQINYSEMVNELEKE